MIELWVATSNQGKLNEFKNLLSKVADIRSSNEIKVYSQPPENGKTFAENARIKARSLKSVKPGCWVVADDSGLEVEGLGGLPGIHSARYAGENARDSENVAKLLKMMAIRTPTNRNAVFKCVFVVYAPDGSEKVIETLKKGTISNQARGTTGFGYDPVFIPEGETKTYSELGISIKNQGSHRALAIQQLAILLGESRSPS